MTRIYSTQYRSMTSGNVYTITAHNNVLIKRYGMMPGKWTPVRLNPEDIHEMVKAGILYKTRG